MVTVRLGTVSGTEARSAVPASVVKGKARTEPGRAPLLPCGLCKISMPLEEPSYESTPQVQSARSTFSIRAPKNSGTCPAFMRVELPQSCCGACGIGDGGSLAVPQSHRRVEYCGWSRPSYARSRQLISTWQTARRPRMSVGTCARSADDKHRSKSTSVPRLSMRSRPACSFRGLVCRAYDCLMPHP